MGAGLKGLREPCELGEGFRVGVGRERVTEEGVMEYCGRATRG